METVAVSKLRQNLVMYLKKVENGESLAITSRGRKIARLAPLEKKWKRRERLLPVYGKMRL